MHPCETDHALWGLANNKEICGTTRTHPPEAADRHGNSLLSQIVKKKVPVAI